MKHMTQIYVWKEITFDAAHHLEGYEGPCANVHGHTYKVQLGVLSPIQKATGIAVDMTDIAQFLNDHVKNVYDHQDLNEIMKEPPTAEMLAMGIVQKAIEHFKKPVAIVVYETPTSWVYLEGMYVAPQRKVIIPKDIIPSRRVD